ELDPRLAQDLAQEKPAGEMGHGEAVRLRHVVQVIGGDEAAGPGHVLDDDGGMSGDLLGHVPGDDPGVRVEAAPRGKTDDDPYGLPLVKLPGLRSAADHGEHEECRQQGGGSPAHRVLPRSEEHTSELQSRFDLVCRLLLEKKKYNNLLIPTCSRI